MFGDHFAPARQLLATLQSVVGPTREVNDVRNATTRGQWEHRGEYRGRPLAFQLTHRYTSQSVGRLLGVELRAPLGGRPVELTMDFAPLVPGQPPAPLPDNAGSLFPHGLVTGHPMEVVRAAFDPATTALVNATIGPKGLRVTSSGDWLTVFVHVGEPPAAPIPDAAELGRMLEFVFTLAARLVAAFDQAHEAAVRAGGPQGGAQWLASQQAARSQRTADRQRSTMIAIGIAAAVMIAIVVVIIGIVAVAC